VIIDCGGGGGGAEWPGRRKEKLSMTGGGGTPQRGNGVVKEGKTSNPHIPNMWWTGRGLVGSEQKVLSVRVRQCWAFWFEHEKGFVMRMR